MGHLRSFALELQSSCHDGCGKIPAWLRFRSPHETAISRMPCAWTHDLRRGSAGSPDGELRTFFAVRRLTEHALPARDHDGCDAVAHHVDGRPRHVHELVD